MNHCSDPYQDNDAFMKRIDSDMNDVIDVEEPSIRVRVTIIVVSIRVSVRVRRGAKPLDFDARVRACLLEYLLQPREPPHASIQMYRHVYCGHPPTLHVAFALNLP